MANEFEFLRARWPKLAALGADAARLVDFSPVTALSSLRDYCEWAADITLDVLGNAMAPDTPQLERLSALKAMGSVPPDILQKFHNIRATEDRVSGNPLGDPNEARARMADAVDIGRWLMRQDGSAPAAGYTARPAASRSGYGSGEDMYATGRKRVRREPAAESAYAPDSHEDDDVRQDRYDDRRQDSYDGEYANDSYEGDGYDDNAYDDNGYDDEYDYDNGRGWNSRGGIGGLVDRLDLGRYKRYLTMPVIISAVLIIVLLIGLLLILSRCGGKTPATTTTPPSSTPAETVSMLVTPTPTPTPSPTPIVPSTSIKYLDEFAKEDIVKSHTAWENYYLGKWTANSHNANFSIFNGGSGSDAKGVLYEHGLGWFIKSGDFANASERRALTFNTNGQYTALTFDMGIDKEWLFDDAPNCGTYQLMVFVDDGDTPIWTSDEVNYNYYKTGISIDVTGAQKVKIRLIEKKGSKGSLNVVLGDAGFVSSGEAAPAAPTSDETTPAEGGDETGSADETTTPAAE